jgi:hypothetical protein
MLQIIKRISKNRQSIWSVSLLSVQAILLGFFVALFFIDATANFLVFHTVRVLPEAFVASALAGIIIMQIIHATDSLKSQRLKFFLQYFFIFISFAGLIGLQFLTYTKFFLFFYFAAFIPFSIILVNIMRSTTLSLKITNSTLLVNIIDAVYIIGVILAGVWAYLFKRTNIIPIEYILAAVLCVILLLQLVIGNYKSRPQITEQYIKPIKTLISYFSELPLKGILLVTGLFIILSAVSFSLIDYTFLNSLGTLYPSTVKLTKFLILFILSTTILSYIFKLFVYQNLIKTFKLNKAIIFAPLISIGAVSAIAFMTLFPKRFNMDTVYALMFLSLVFSRIFIQLIRESFEFYSLKLNLVSQESLSNRKIDSGVLTTFNFWAFFFSGIVLMILKSVEVNNMQQRLLINLGVALLWLLIAFALNRTYNKSLQRFVKGLTNSNPVKTDNNKEVVKEFDGNNISYLRYILNYQSYYQPHHFHKVVKQLPDNLKARLGITISKNSFFENGSSPSNSSSNGQGSSYFDSTKGSTSGYVIESLTESISTSDRIRAVRLITESKNPKYINILKVLIRDPDDEVKRQAISAITKFKSTDLIYEALEYLAHEDYADLVCDVLMEIGPDAVKPLSHTFNNPNIDIRYQTKIIKTIAQIPSVESNTFLLSNLEYPNKSIVYEAALALIKTEYKPSPSESSTLLRAIDKAVGNCAWLLNMSLIFERDNKTAYLHSNLVEEYKYTFELLMVLMEIRYGKALVNYLKQSRREGASNEQKEYVIEILNLVIEPELKLKLFPLLHNNSRSEVVKQLQNQYPISEKPTETAIKELINIDLGYISKWTKSTAIIALSQFQDVSQSEDIIAQLYNPEPILSEAAVYSIRKWGNKSFSALESRLPDRIYPKLRLLSENIDLNKYHLLNQKVFYLKKLHYFSHVKGESLLHLAEVMDGILLLTGHSLIFETKADEILPLFLSPHGELTVSDGGKNSKKLRKGHLFGLNVYTGKLKIEATKEDSFLYVLKPENLTSVVLNFEDISDALFNYLKESKIH